MRPAKKEYEYGVDQCSVNDKALLNEFREKRSEWMDWFERDDQYLGPNTFDDVE